MIVIEVSQGVSWLRAGVTGSHDRPIELCIDAHRSRVQTRTSHDLAI